MKQIPQPLYDRIRIEKETVSAAFFQKPLGSDPAGVRLASGTITKSNRPLNQLCTNMDQGSSLPYPKNFYITGLSIISESGPNPAIPSYVSSSWARLFIKPCDYLVLPLAFLHKRADEFDINKPVFVWDEPVKLPPQTDFRVEVNTPHPTSSGGDFDLYCILHGYFQRDIQISSEKIST